MINELIEKEIDKVAENSAYGFASFVQLRQSLKNIAKEVAMRFKNDPNEPSKDDINFLADQIINEVSE